MKSWYGLSGFIMILALIVYLFWPVHWIWEDPQNQDKGIRAIVGIIMLCIGILGGLAVAECYQDQHQNKDKR